MTDEEIKLNAVAIVECWYDKPTTEEEEIKAWQHLIDSGLCWQLQGWFGRMAIRLVQNGYCVPSQFMIDRKLMGDEWVEQENEQTELGKE
jgi:hypothetical protein